MVFLNRNTSKKINYQLVDKDFVNRMLQESSLVVHQSNDSVHTNLVFSVIAKRITAVNNKDLPY